jgi:AcrR family transcriptional regulator
MLTGVNKPARPSPLEGALTLLRREGPGALTMRNVAAEIGVTATALYRHFDDKSDLMRAVVREVYGVFRQCITVPDRKDPLDALRDACGRFLRFARAHPDYYRLLFVEAHGIGIDRYPGDFHSGRSPAFRHLTDLVRRCIAAGLFRKGNPADIALTLYAQMHGLVMLHFAGRFANDDMLFERFYVDSIDRLITGLAA